MASDDVELLEPIIPAIRLGREVRTSQSTRKEARERERNKDHDEMVAMKSVLFLTSIALVLLHSSSAFVISGGPRLGECSLYVRLRSCTMGQAVELSSRVSATRDKPQRLVLYLQEFFLSYNHPVRCVPIVRSISPGCCLIYRTHTATNTTQTGGGCHDTCVMFVTAVLSN